ncbi:MAG: prepilin-type N-terminal cleavage/methylation domain-containing protein [Clostridiales Family XIII bacterium]|jgi:prepilin-type N-terminal cleavage/methylation domain-containing protein|nr:prepilin-type N-terminal cleavage/methylation domain-containing protein [Clostridiales Family XIII bacterium]
MNMILKKRLANRGVTRSGWVAGRCRKGFTLMEVIVVLVILAILVAIAIPALTGYIYKGEDKKYIGGLGSHDFVAIIISHNSLRVRCGFVPFIH